MKYHYETMPLPGPTSWYFHYLPQWLHKASVLFNHFVELILPFFYFASRPFRHWAGTLTLVFQFILIASGNFSWLNHITVVIALACFDDQFFSWLGSINAWAKSMGVPLMDATVSNSMSITSGIPAPLIYGVATLVAYLSLSPVRNLLSQRQIMNTSFDPLHIVNTYGAFGSITRVRYEVVISGSSSLIGPWIEYEFKGKPGDVSRRPPWVSPYHYKLDWQMWFAAMSSYRYHPWILNFVANLLKGNSSVTELLAFNPFSEAPPNYIKADLFEYKFAEPGNRDWWQRKYVEQYLPPLSLSDPYFRDTLKSQGWLEP